MNILTWIHNNCPGTLLDFGDRIEVEHDFGRHSTLWKKKTDKTITSLICLGECFAIFDGMDLFSSAFKLASTSHPQHIDGVRLTFTLLQLEDETQAAHCSFPSGSIPFMYQAGIGYYAIDPLSGLIYEWDTELEEISEVYDSLEAILLEWVAAVS